MASTLIQPLECCTSCTEPVNTNVPGEAGSDGAAGAAGANGIDAFSVIDGGTTIVPAYGATNDVPLLAPAGSLWMGVGQVVYVAQYGYYRVEALPDALTATLLNLSYAGNVDGDGLIAFGAGVKVQPGGLEGPSGAVPVGALLASHNLDDLADAATARTNLGLGTMATQNENAVAITGGTAILTGGTITGITDLALADGGTGASNAADARINLGLGTLAVQDANNVAITGGTITGVTFPTQLAYSLYQNQQASTVSGGSFASGGWVAVPLNTEVVAGGYGSIALDTITLLAGTYRVRWRCPALQVGSFQTRLYNVTAGVALAQGSNARSVATDDTSASSDGEFRFTLAIGSDVQLQARCVVDNLADGFGKAAGFGSTEVYASVELERES